MRICSLVPAATETLFALGLGDQVVGVTHECDWPPEAADRPIVTASLIQTGDLSSVEVDRVVAETARDGRPLYAIDEERWVEVDADVVLLMLGTNDAKPQNWDAGRFEAELLAVARGAHDWTLSGALRRQRRPLP